MNINDFPDTTDILQAEGVVEDVGKENKGNRITGITKKEPQRLSMANTAGIMEPNVPVLNSMISNDYGMLPKFIRRGFLLFGFCFVLYGFHGTMVKISQRNILISEEVVVEDKFTYPSITFCYKYKHGGKDVFKNYYPSLYEKWRNSGIPIKSNI